MSASLPTRHEFTDFTIKMKAMNADVEKKVAGRARYEQGSHLLLSTKSTARHE